MLTIYDKEVDDLLDSLEERLKEKELQDKE